MEMDNRKLSYWRCCEQNYHQKCFRGVYFVSLYRYYI